MINRVLPVYNSSESLILFLYKQAQLEMEYTSKLVFYSLEKFAGSDDGALSIDDLKKIKSYYADKTNQSSKLLSLVDTIISKFEQLSSDGKNITFDDFMFATKFSVAQEISQNSTLYEKLKPNKSNFGQELIDKYGITNLLAVDLIASIEKMPTQTINKLKLKLEKFDFEKKTIMKITDKNESEIQDYRTITAKQLKSPISISI